MKRTRLFPVCAALLALLLGGCARPGGRVASGNREQILYQGNASEPSDLDPQTVIGTAEANILRSLFEGLVAQDPKDLHPIPGMAENWEISPDGLTYTFHLRRDNRWSNGEPLTAQDFLDSYRRILLPVLGAQYASMLYADGDVVNAREFYEGKITDFSQVGFHAPDPYTFVISLNHPVGYFLQLLSHQSWYPVHLPTILKYGKIDHKATRWTLPGNLVCNGPFRLKAWRTQQEVVVEKNPRYWDAGVVRLKEIHYYPTENIDSEERDFRARQLHLTYELPQSKVDFYRRNYPQYLRTDPYLGVYYYRINVTNPVVKDKRLRRALAMAVDRVPIVKEITRGGQLTANNFVPPDPAGYTCHSSIPTDIEGARKLLAEAGYPNGQGLPTVEILINTNQNHKQIAEAVQEMWRRNLNINVSIVNQEWKVYLDSQHTLNYCVSRSAWIGDYNDPLTFLGTMLSDSGNNDTGFKNADYDRAIAESTSATTNETRFAALNRAEAILLDEAPVIPIYFYTRVYLLQPSVKGWYPNILDEHTPKFIYLDDAAPVETIGRLTAAGTK